MEDPFTNHGLYRTIISWHRNAFFKIFVSKPYKKQKIVPKTKKFPRKGKIRHPEKQSSMEGRKTQKKEHPQPEQGRYSGLQQAVRPSTGEHGRIGGYRDNATRQPKTGRGTCQKSAIQTRLGSSGAGYSGQRMMTAASSNPSCKYRARAEGFCASTFSSK